MSDFRTEIYAANLDFRRYSRGIQGDLTFEELGESGWVTMLTIKRGWCCDYVVNQSTGLPEVQVEIAEQAGVRNIFQLGVLALGVEGIRYERRDQDLMLGLPRVYRFRCQPTGEEAVEMAYMRRANTTFVQ